jgi:hypothetical protein
MNFKGVSQINLAAFHGAQSVAESREQARARSVAQQPRSCVGRLHSRIECVGTYVDFKSVVGVYICVCTWIGLGIIYVLVLGT